MNNEQAKAIQEVAKATSKAIEVSERLGRFLHKIVGTSLEELGGTFSDWTKYYRYKNLLKLQEKVDSLHSQRGIQGNTVQIMPRHAIPLLQGASEEDDESLQNMWANLIANSTDPVKRLKLKKVFIDILKSLEPLDARVLTHLSAHSIVPWSRDREDRPLYPPDNPPGRTSVPPPRMDLTFLASALSVSRDELETSLQNLARLGCVIDERRGTQDKLDISVSGLRVWDPECVFAPTPLGLELLKICGSVA